MHLFQHICERVIASLFFLLSGILQAWVLGTAKPLPTQLISDLIVKSAWRSMQNQLPEEGFSRAKLGSLVCAVALLCDSSYDLSREGIFLGRASIPFPRHAFFKSAWQQSCFTCPSRSLSRLKLKRKIWTSGSRQSDVHIAYPVCCVPIHQLIYVKWPVACEWSILSPIKTRSRACIDDMVYCCGNNYRFRTFLELVVAKTGSR